MNVGNVGLPAKAATSRRFALDARETQRFTVPPWGYLEGVEIFPRMELPNMDAGSSYTVEVALRDPNGNLIPVDVVAVVRDVTWGSV